MVKIGINGLGRIGRLTIRNIIERKLNGEDVELIADAALAIGDYIADLAEERFTF